jgi:cytochrome c oxidase assembly protein subunit 15
MLNNKNYNTIFNIWLICLIVLVSLIIIIGGLTRLTDSGLSITEWELFKGIFPPASPEAWINYFDSYKKIPQYTILNNNMTLDEFKYIYFWEYIHRLLARFIGLFFLVPFFFFIFFNVLKKSTSIRLLNIFILILAQGAIGWFMVKSGLVENVSVSHYRLSLHLIIAFSILSSLVWILLNFNRNTKKKILQFNLNNISLKLLLSFIFIQIILGAFVSGLDAGKIYQTWPLMNDNFFPDDASINNVLNFNQPSIVQFYHRNLGYFILLVSIFLGFNIFKNKDVDLYNSYLLFISLILLQIVLGISVLISGANIFFASMHQISSIFLVTAVLSLYHRSIRL